MFKFLRHELSSSKIDSIKEKALEAAENDDIEALWAHIKPLMQVQSRQESAASSLIEIVREAELPIEDGIKILTPISESHSENIGVLSKVGESLEHVRDIDMLNAAPSKDDLFLNVVDKLASLSEGVKGTDEEEQLLEGLSTAARMVSRQRDDLAEQSYKRLVEIAPDNAAHHYNLGLFYKTRGRFKEGVIANQKAASLVDEPVESYEWNLGICATGAGDGEVALEVWERIGQKIKPGRFNLPEGGYPQCKVRLAERPLSERSSEDDDPGLEETIWIERLSPSHGIIRSVLYQDLGVHYGDVILMNGAPITYHTYGEREVPVFPHLATLKRRNYQFFDFIGTQEAGGEIAELDRDFEDDIVIYPHTENYITLCATCWRDPNTDHEHHEAEERHIVSGKITAPKGIPESELLDKLDALVNAQSSCKLLVPSLSRAAGQIERAEIESRRYGMLSDQI